MIGEKTPYLPPGLILKEELKNCGKKFIIFSSLMEEGVRRENATSHLPGWKMRNIGRALCREV